MKRLNEYYIRAMVSLVALVVGIVGCVILYFDTFASKFSILAMVLMFVGIVTFIVTMPDEWRS